MPFIDWSDSYSVSVQLIDEQHRKLFDIINRLHDAMKAGKGRDVLGNVFAELLQYTVSHFSTEEKLFKQHGYLETVLHSRQHADLTKQALALKDKFEKGGMITLEVMNFLKDWLNNHILQTDKKYTAFLNAKGVK